MAAIDDFDRAMTFIVHISLERERSDLFDQFKKRIRNSCQIQQCYYVTGNADFILLMTAASMQDYEAFANAFFFDDSNVRSFHTYVVMQKIKTGQFVPAFADGSY